MKSEVAVRPDGVTKDDLSNPHAAEPSTQGWGRIYVTRRCCGAANCRNFAPELFGEVAPANDGAAPSASHLSVPQVLPDSHDEGAFSGAIRQPASKEDYLAARTAAAACGFGAIRVERPLAPLPREELGSPWREWPRRIEGNVWMVGQPAKKNYGALAYFIERSAGGVLVDVPTPSKELFDWLEAHGGVRWLLLTHRDHVQHHAEFAARFPGCRRVIGAFDVNKRQNPYADATGSVEVKLSNGLVPMTLDGTPIPLEALAATELAVLPQPGHTPGSLCLLYQGRFLFTGDHLAYSRRLGHMIAHRLQCWQDWGRQTRSVNQLAMWAEAGLLRFQWLLPGHGELIRLEGDGSPTAAATELRRAVEWMSQQPSGRVPLLRWIPFVLSRANPRGKFGRLVLAIGGEGRDSWLLPRAARKYLTDFDPAGSDAAIHRLYGVVFAALAAAGLVTWWATHP